MMARTHRSAIARELLLAALVVALMFLNFGHSTFVRAGEPGFSADSWCGDPATPDAPGHAPCHVCRIGGGADLPPVPAMVEPVCFVAIAVLHHLEFVVPPLSAGPTLAQPRGPPVLA